MKKVFILLSLIALCSGAVHAQGISVTGRVVSNEEPDGIPGVNVIIKGTTIGTVTDINGMYKINAPSDQSILRFSSVGYTPQEIMVGNQKEINVTLQSDVQAMEEVIVVGYGEQRKASVVGAISNIKSEELKRAAPSNLTANIGGRITGALVRLGDGNVGGGDYRYASAEIDNAQIFIRGRATSNPASPLIIVDGVESHFNRLNPEDVEQLSVLKDASATAVYGVRGANGVIVVTTKQGTLGKPKINVNAQVRAHSPLKYPRPLGSYDYARLKNEAWVNGGGKPLFTEEDLELYKNGADPVFHPDVDWYSELVKPFFIEEQYNANVSGGTEKVKYYISGEYNHAGGPWKARKDMQNDYKRYNLRTNIDFNITKTTDLSVKLNGRMETRGDVNYGESTGQRYYGSFWYHISACPPNIAPIRWPNGTWAYGTDGTWNVRAILEEGGYRTRMSNALDASLNLRQKLDFILPGLSASALYSSTYQGGYRTAWGVYEQIPAKWDYKIDPVTGADIYTMRAPKFPHERATQVDNENFVSFNRRFQTEFSLKYDHIFAEKHRVDAMVLFQQSKQENNYDLPVSTRGFAGRFNYSYQMKYIADISAAYNGSDRFAKDKRYALFPAAAVGWVISEESFWKNRITFIPYLKIRGGYGTVGNDRIAEGMRYMYRYSFNGSPMRYTEPVPTANETYNFGEDPQKQFGLYEGALGNERVTWEVARKSNIGIDLHVWKSKIRLSGEVFLEKRDNILAIRGDVPDQTGLGKQTGQTSSTLPPVNIRKVSNRGYEFEVLYNDKFGEFDLTVGGNYSFARSNVEEWAEVPQKYAYRMVKGHPVEQPYGYIWTGEFYTYADLLTPSVPKPSGTVQAGDLKFKDLNGDGVIDADDQTRELGKKGIGYGAIPEIIYGFNTNFGYKGFYLDVFWQGAAHVSSRWINEVRYEFYGNKGGNVYACHLNRWTPETETTATYPRLGIGGAPLTREPSTFQYINSAFLRLKSLELGYNVPHRMISGWGMSALRVFIGGSNLLTFDKVGFIDPEYNAQENGNRGNSYPQTKFFSLGVNVSF